MDLPLKLEQEATVSDVEEVKQTLITLLKNERHSFMQAASRGCTGLIHTTGNSILVDLYAQGVVDQVKGCTLINTQTTFDSVSGEQVLRIEMEVEYNAEALKLVFSNGDWT